MFVTDKIKVKIDGSISKPEEVKFTLRCDKCGDEHVRFIDTHVYNENVSSKQYITISFVCTKCGNTFEFIVDGEAPNESSVIDDFGEKYGYYVDIIKFYDGTIIPALGYATPRECGYVTCFRDYLKRDISQKDMYRLAFIDKLNTAKIIEDDIWYIAVSTLLKKYNLTEYIV